MERLINVIIKTTGAYCGDETGECPQLTTSGEYTLCKCAAFIPTEGSYNGKLLEDKFLRSYACCEHFNELEMKNKEENRLLALCAQSNKI